MTNDKNEYWVNVEWWSIFSQGAASWFTQVLASATSPEQALSAETFFSHQNVMSTEFNKFWSWRVLRYDYNASVLICFRIRQTLCLSHFDEKKNVSGLSACLALVTLARTSMSHDAAPQEKTLHRSVLVGVSTCHEFWSELTLRTGVPRYVVSLKVPNLSMILRTYYTHLHFL